MTTEAIVSASAAPGADYAATAGEAYRAALRVIESVEPRIAAGQRHDGVGMWWRSWHGGHPSQENQEACQIDEEDSEYDAEENAHGTG